MRRPVALLLSSLIVATASTLVEHSIASAATATVAGVVTDTSGNPIAGATVVAQREPNVSFGLTATSGPDGHYAISGLSDGSWKVVASAPGYGVRFGNAARWEDGASIDVTADGTVAFDVILPRNTASISGTVVDPDGNRLPAVQVSVAPAVGWGTSFFVPVDFSSLFRTVVTDEHGDFRVDNLADSPPLDLTSPMVVCPDAPEYQIGQFAILVATAFDDVAPLQQTVYQYPDTSAECEFSVTVYAADYAGNTASEDCPYRVAGDRDDVESAVEDGAPNGGDGNADGIPDRNQPYVTSLPEPDGDGYVTVVNAFNAQQHLVSSSTVADAGATPPGIDLVGGAYDVRLDYPYASLYVARSDAPVNPQLAAWDGTEWTRWPGFVFDGDALDLDGPFNSTVTLRIAPAEIDITPPDIECAAGTPQFLLNDPGASISVAVSDDDSGVESPVVTVPVDAHSFGDHWAFVVASDRIGNVNFAFCPYRVGVDVEVIDPDRVVMGKAGRPIPIEWRASDFNGDSVDDVGHFLSISTVPLACPHGRLVLAGNSTSGGPTLDSGTTWRYGVTAPTQKGCYTVTVHAVGDDASAVIRVT